MKLLFVTHWANNMLIFRTWMLQEAVRRGHDVLVLCPPDAEAGCFAALGARHIPWKLRRGGGITNMLAAIWDARRVIRCEHPDRTVVYCVQPIMAMLWAWKLGGRSGRLFPTFTGLGSLWTDLEYPSWKKRLVRGGVERVLGWLLPQAERVFVLNRDDKTQVASWNKTHLLAMPGILEKYPTSTSPPPLTSSFPRRRESNLPTPVIQTQGEGVDLAHFQPASAEERAAARNRWNIPAKAHVIGFAGRLIREKGAQDFLTLCQEMQQDDNVHFLVVGTPDPGNPASLTPTEMQELKTVPRLHHEPWMDDVRPAYAAMDMLAFLSQYREGLPIVPQEAMAMGIPVVAYDNVGTREVVTKEFLTPAGEMELLLRPVRLLLVESAKYRAAMREAVQGLGRQTVQGDFLNGIEG